MYYSYHKLSFLNAFVKLVKLLDLFGYLFHFKACTHHNLIIDFFIARPFYNNSDLFESLNTLRLPSAAACPPARLPAGKLGPSPAESRVRAKIPIYSDRQLLLAPFGLSFIGLKRPLKIVQGFR